MQRGSVMDMPIYPGDPLTPGMGVRAGRQEARSGRSKTLLKIPVLPISYGDALPLLRSLKGPVAPEAWRGALPITYHVGPGPAKVHLKLAFDWQVRPLYNVIARIPGREFPDEWIIHGNHHDAWVNGASDPTSGNVALMETARGLGELLKSGWKPKRTIVIASWDGEEWGLLGSTEWVEKHQDGARDQGGRVHQQRQHRQGLAAAWRARTRCRRSSTRSRATCPIRAASGKSVLEAKRDRELNQAQDRRAKRQARSAATSPIDALGSGSDYTAFLDHLHHRVARTSASAATDGGGVYHSVYDSFYWYTHFSDGDFTHTRGAVARHRHGAPAAGRRRHPAVRVHQHGHDADAATSTRSRSWPLDAKDRRRSRAASQVDRAAADAAAQRYEAALARRATGQQLTGAPPSPRRAQPHALLHGARLPHEAGLPRREWFKHLAYAPGFYTGYGVKTLPGIREGIEQKQCDEAAPFVPIVAAAIDRLRARRREGDRAHRQQLMAACTCRLSTA